MPSFLPKHCEVTKDELDKYLNEDPDNDDVPYELYCMIDQVFHHNEPDYRGGLSFFHRINKKVPKYDERTLHMLENFIQNDEQSQILMLEALFTKSDMAIYGI